MQNAPAWSYQFLTNAQELPIHAAAMNADIRQWLFFGQNEFMGNKYFRIALPSVKIA